MIELIEQTVNRIDNLITEQLPESKYQFELYDLTTNTKHFRGLDEHFHWGSVYKLFVVAEIIKMSEEGYFKMEDKISLQKDLFRNGNGIGKHFKQQNELTYTDACVMVMGVSDGLCADGLLNIVGFVRLEKLFKLANCADLKLSVNLDTMVSDLFAGSNTSIGINYYHTPEFFSHFKEKLFNLSIENYATATDTNECFNFIMTNYLTTNGTKILKELILVPNLHSRISTYTFYFGKFLMRGKTGMLGLGIVNNESVAIINKHTLEICGYFSIYTKDSQERYYQTNDVFGLVGIEIVSLYEQLAG
jgi:hypothetical protein